MRTYTRRSLAGGWYFFTINLTAPGATAGLSSRTVAWVANCAPGFHSGDEAEKTSRMLHVPPCLGGLKANATPLCWRGRHELTNGVKDDSELRIMLLKLLFKSVEFTSEVFV